jgi:hypothetical protein
VDIPTLKLGFYKKIYFTLSTVCGPVSSVGIVTDYGLDDPGIESRWDEIFPHPDWPWGPPSLLYNGYRVFPGGKERLGCAAVHSPPSIATVMEEQSYTSTHPLGHNKVFNGDTLPIYVL